HHALQRVVRFGAGWLASLQPIPAMEQAARRLTTLAAQAGGPTPPMGTLVFAALTADGNPAPGRRLVRHLVDTYGRSPELADELVVAGDPAALAERLAALHDLGVRQFVLSGYGADFSEQYRLLARGADELRRRLAHGRVGASRSP
ncbi:MAG: hypothetical protein ACRDRL_27980, partial [Sciscionella sp.]